MEKIHNKIRYRWHISRKSDTKDRKGYTNKWNKSKHIKNKVGNIQKKDNHKE